MKQAPKQKTKLGVKDSFILLSKSKYLLSIAMLVLCYGVGINLIEVVYKSQIKLQFPHENDLCAFTGKVSIFTGGVTFIMVSLSANILRFMGWIAAAMITPVLLYLTGAIFFGFVLFDETLASFLSFTPLWIAVVVGAAQNILSKSMKYSLFDPTKEMAYIPLDLESKVKGKAAIDVVGARLGKSLGGIVLQVLFLFGSILQNLPILFFTVSVIIGLWILSVLSLNRQYTSKLEPEESPSPAALKVETT